MVRRTLAGRRRLPASRRTRPERLLLISGGSGITPVMSMLRTLCAEGTPGPSPSCTTPRPASARHLPQRARARSRARHPNVRLVRAYTREPAAASSTGTSAATTSTRSRPDLRRRRDLRLRPARRCSRRCAGSGPRTASRSGCTSRASCPPTLALAGDRAEGSDPLRRLRRAASTTAAARCSSRPRTPASARSPAAAWASATPAPAARRRAPSEPVTGEVSSRRRRGDPDLRLGPRRRRRPRPLNSTSTGGDTT